MKSFRLILTAFVLMLVLDLSWASIVAHQYYTAQLGALLSPHPVLWALAAFYVIYSVAIVQFVVLPARHESTKQKGIKRAVEHGALLGLAAYGTYDLVNLGVLANYPTGIVLVDIAWGMVVTIVVSVATYLLTRKSRS